MFGRMPSSMRCEVDAGQIESYRANGFLAIDNFLNADELENWRVQVDEAVKERLASASQGLHNQFEPDSYYSKVFVQCVKLADTHEGVRRIILDERIGKLAGTLAGVQGIRVWHDQALIKQPFGNPTGWHLDNPYWSFDSPDSISIWVALDDATLANGCMWYLPGTHLDMGRKNADISSNLGALFELNPDWREIEPVPVPCKAGSAVLHNGLVAHAAGANMTNKPRRAMTCAYMPDGSVFNGQRNVLPEDYFASLKVGDLLDSDTINPLVWKASG